MYSRTLQCGQLSVHLACFTDIAISMNGAACKATHLLLDAPEVRCLVS